MSILLPAALFMVLGGVVLRIWYRRRRARRIAARRRVEAPNSHYSSQGVRNHEDRERWHEINLVGLHPLNQEEVSRLLEIVDANGVGVLSPKERLFLDNMAVPRLSH